MASQMPPGGPQGAPQFTPPRPGQGLPPQQAPQAVPQGAPPGAPPAPPMSGLAPGAPPEGGVKVPPELLQINPNINDPNWFFSVAAVVGKSKVINMLVEANGLAIEEEPLPGAGV